MPKPKKFPKSANTDGEEGVTEPEFSTALKNLAAGTASEDDASSLFASINTNNDAVISEEELSDYFETNKPKQGPPPPPPDLSLLLNILSASSDSGSDNKIDIASLLAKLSAIDTNGDGVIDEDELKTYLQANMPQPVMSGLDGSGTGSSESDSAGGNISIIYSFESFYF